MTVITPARSINPVDFGYEVRGVIARVFGTNGCGELLPLEYTDQGGGKFALIHAPYGQIYAEVVR